MAKKTKDSGFSPKGFIAAGLVLMIVFSLNIFLLGYVYHSTAQNDSTISQEMSFVNSANGALNGVNREVAEIVGQIGQMQGHISAITSQFGYVNTALGNFEAMENHSEEALYRLHAARAYINAYSSKLAEYRDEFNRYVAAGDGDAKEAFIDRLPAIYNQEIAPLANASGQMLIAVIQIANTDAGERSATSVRTVYFLMALIIGILILCEVGLYFFARITKKSVEEIEHKNKQVAEASNKLSRSREKMEEAVQKNFLTGFKNRYSLEKDIGERLASEQFNIAAFDIDGFKGINDMYGYDFGDEYLVQIAERLKNEFSQSAEIYNITGNEFVFVFHREVSDSQTIRLVENIVSVMNAPYTIFNLTVQLTVSAAHYHYMAGDCLNVNSLLVKLDNVIRTAKHNGGGQILPVADL